jgi:hypothetical protein
MTRRPVATPAGCGSRSGSRRLPAHALRIPPAGGDALERAPGLRDAPEGAPAAT